MREILFRGKKNNNGEWIYGDLSICDDCDPSIYDTQTGNRHFRMGSRVLCESIGQYTGLTDKNGKKIFEGDICQIKGISYIDETPFVIEWNNDWGGWYWRDLDFGSATDSFTHSIAKTSKVIGNIHDNPELLEGGEQE